MSFVLVIRYHRRSWVLGTDDLFHKPGSDKTRLFDSQQQARDVRRRFRKVNTTMFIRPADNIDGDRVVIVRGLSR
ncbi:MAG: hypothetical protein EVA65_16585 [Oceanococcus sp.]|nr:MAG: hypothetical protein EVA65_16585 [Oceanococcus sp.]